jgi:hypothetical protein
MPEELPDDVNGVDANHSDASTQIVKAESEASISNVSQSTIGGDVLESIVLTAGRDINVFHQPIVVHAASSKDDIALECASFEAYLKTGPRRKLSGDDEETPYVIPTLMWQHDIDQKPFLHDPDAREVWLGMIKQAISVPLSDVTKYRRVLVVGEFNTGKTRLLAHICKTALGQWKDEPVRADPVYPIPISVPLRYYHDPGEPFVSYLQRITPEIYGDFSQAASNGPVPPEGALRAGDYLFLLDGLDELGGAQRTELLRHIRDFVDQYPQHRYVFSGRRSAYGAAEAFFTEIGFEMLTIAPFSRRQIRDYLELRGLADTPLGDALQQRRDLLALARIPGSLKLCCDIGGKAGDLPARLSTLYEILVTSQLSKEIKRNTAVIPRMGLTRPVLNGLALEMTRRGTFSLAEDEVEKVVVGLTKGLGFSEGYSVREWLDEIRHREILISYGNEVSFPYRAWQEYLTAYALAEAPLDSVLASAYVNRGKVRGFNPFWYQVLRFLVEMRSDLLEVLYEREEIIAARCTPLTASNPSRLRAFAVIFSTSAKQGMSLYSSVHASRDFYDDHQTCIDLNPVGAVAYLDEQYQAESASPVTKDDAFGLLVDYAANGDDEAIEIVVGQLPDLLDEGTEDGGLRETAAYAVSRLNLQNFIPRLLSLYESEKNDHVRQAILWSIATLDPRKARTLFTQILLQSLGARIPSSVSEQALTIALPRLLDEQLIYEIKDRLVNLTHDVVSIPEKLVELLIKHETEASRETLVVMATHFLVQNLSREGRSTIYTALAQNRAWSVRYLLEHAEDEYVGPAELAYTLAALLDQSTLTACKNEIASPALPGWIVNRMYQLIMSEGKHDVADRLVLLRPDIDKTPTQEPREPVQETLGELLTQPGWQDGKVFGAWAEHYVKQVDTLAPGLRKQLEEYVVEKLKEVDFAQLFRQVGEHQYTSSPYILVCLMYAAALNAEITSDLYDKLLSVDFENESILVICDQAYSPERDEGIINWIQPDAPEACIARAAELCARHIISPQRTVPALGNVLKEICSRAVSNDANLMNLTYRLIQAISKYGQRGAAKLDSLISQVHQDCAILLARARLSLSPPSALAEVVYLQYLIAIVGTGAVNLWDRELQYMQTADAIPLLFELLRKLIVARKEAASLSSDSQTVSASMPGIASTEMKSSILLTYVLDALTRLASEEVLQQYENLLYDFPDETWLNRYYEYARRVYLASY